MNTPSSCMKTEPNFSFPWLFKKPSPLPKEAIHQAFRQNSPDEGTAVAYTLKLKVGFSYRTLLSEMICVYVTCCLLP